METSMVVDRGKAGAELFGETLQKFPPVILIRRRRRSRAERLADALEEALPTVARIGLVVAVAGAAVGIAAYVARKRLFTAAAVVADSVKEAADAAGDAAKDAAKAVPDANEAPKAG